METNLKTTLRNLADDAKHALRTGERPDDNWLENGWQTVHDLAAPGEYDPSDQPLILATLHRLVDLADRLAQDEKARTGIGDYLDWAVVELKKTNMGDVPERVTQLIWYIVSYCVTEHRVGGVRKALEYVQRAAEALKALPEHQYLELRCRVEYSLGRHYQSLATSRDFLNAETHYGKALEICSQIAARNHSGDVEYASYRSSIIMIGLSRVFLNRGELNRAWRDLLVAKVILSGSQDTLTRSYVDYLIGSILRQQSGRVTESIEILKAAVVVFKDIRHKRHYMQCRHELAKALLSNGNLREALEVLKRPIEGLTFAMSSKTKANFTRWDWDDQILFSRILFELERNNADEIRPLNNATLESIRSGITEALDHLSPHDTRTVEIRARGLIVLGEIALAQNPSGRIDSKSLDALLDCLTTANHKPLDRTDVGWGWLVIAEARLRNGQLNGARAALAEVSDIENDFFSKRKKRLEQELHTMEKGGRWFPPIALPNNPLHWEYYEWQIKHWLLDEVESRGVNKTQQATLLGLPTSTFKDKNWLSSPNYRRAKETSA